MSAMRASFYVAQFIAESGRPFTDREFAKKCLIKIVQETCPDKLPCIKDVSLSASTIIEESKTLPNIFTRH